LPSTVILRDVNVDPLDYSLAVGASDRVNSGPFETELEDATFRVSGPFLRLPSGEATLSALFEQRDERALDAFDDSVSQGIHFFPHREQSVSSAYVEARWPLISPNQNSILGQELEFQTSIRHDRYETTSIPATTSYPVPSREGPLPVLDYRTNTVESTDYTLGFRYVPLEGFTLRASYGTGFLPPSVAQVAYNEQIIPFPFIADPLRPGDFVGNTPFTIRDGGNPQLQPEESRSWAIGAILQPAFAPGLRVSLDYVRIDKTISLPTLNSTPGALSADLICPVMIRVFQGP
jgi:iron complex outermembrane receptor protein